MSRHSRASDGARGCDASSDDADASTTAARELVTRNRQPVSTLVSGGRSCMHSRSRHSRRFVWRMSGARILSFKGEAGPYPVRVVVRLPGVIPGLAEISVRVGDAKTAGVSSVTAQAIQWNLGAGRRSLPDAAKPVPGDPDSLPPVSGS